MKILNALPIAVAPAFLMAYGWYLGQLHQSGPDIAGILLFVTGAAGLVLAVLMRLLARKQPWGGKWPAALAFGLLGCGLAFALLLLFARLHG